MSENPIIYTIGHSTHATEAFIDLLQRHGVRCLVDVRSQPYSRWNPQFNRELLAAALQEAGLRYVDLGASLGGRPKDTSLYEPGSERPNYSRQRQTSIYQRGLAQLDDQARSESTAIMCSEALPWRCHRRLIADALIARGWEVFDIFSPTQTKPHPLTEFARVEQGQVTYPEATLFD